MNNSSQVALILRAPSVGIKLSPGLSCNIETLDIGDRPIGFPIICDIYIHNLSTAQFEDVKLEVVSEDEYFALNEDKLHIFTMAAGELLKKRLTIVPCKIFDRERRIRFTLSVISPGALHRTTRNLKVRSAFDSRKSTLASAVLGKWKYGSQFAFVWRGDVDLYQPVAAHPGHGGLHGLERSRLLMKRYGIPSTLAISGRLSLCQGEWSEFVTHYNYRHEPDELDRFVQYLKTRFNYQHEAEYPTSIAMNGIPVELANHMYFHYYNRFSACADNNWFEGAIPNQFVYSWERSKQKTSFSEQRDNCSKNKEIVKEIFDFDTKAYAAPYNGSDGFTANAIEEAGILVSSAATSPYLSSHQYPWYHHVPLAGQILDSINSARSIHDPFHPQGCERLVECGYVQGDPRDFADFLRLLFILKKVIGNRSHMVLLTHHQRLGGEKVVKYFELFIRELIQHTASSAWITTLRSLGDWWDRIICPKHKSITVEVPQGGNRFIVSNNSGQIDGIPIIARFEGNKICSFNVRCDERCSSTVKMDL